MNFADLSVPPELVAALAKQQISAPSPIQIAAIPVLAAGKDGYLRAETGTGKTLAYLLPLFARIDPAVIATQVVIVAPTHELAIQIHRQACELAVNASRAIRSVLLIGGTATDRQIDKLKTKPQVVVGSPGRIAELIERGKLKTAHIRAVVIDEADRQRSGAHAAAHFRIGDDRAADSPGLGDSGSGSRDAPRRRSSGQQEHRTSLSDL